MSGKSRHSSTVHFFFTIVDHALNYGFYYNIVYRFFKMQTNHLTKQYVCLEGRQTTLWRSSFGDAAQTIFFREITFIRLREIVDR